MNRGLYDLVKNLAEPSKNILDNVLIERFYNTHQLGDNNIEKFKLLIRKGVYPYQYMDSWEKFKLSVPLDKKHYYNELNDSNISDNDVNHIKTYVKHLK